MAKALEGRRSEPPSLRRPSRAFRLTGPFFPGWSAAEPGETMTQHGQSPGRAPERATLAPAPFQGFRFGWPTPSPGSAALHPGLLLRRPLRGLSRGAFLVL